MIYFAVGLLTLSLCTLVYFAFTQHNRRNSHYWSKRDVAGPAPLPFVGNFLKVVLGLKHYSEVYDDIYRLYPKAAYVGVYKMNTPAVLIRDIGLIQDVLHTNFQSFAKNDFIITESRDPLFSMNPFASPTDKWRALRNQISPVFTLAKIRHTLPIMNDISMNFLKYIERECQGNKSTVFNVKELCAKYTIDVVASSALQVDGELFDNPNSEFYRMSTSVFAQSCINAIKNFTVLVYPPLNSIIKLPFVSAEVDTWLRHVVRDVLKFHNLSGTKPSDFLQYLMDLHKTDDNFEFNEDTVVGHALTFLIEGFETSSTLMSFCLYELALNPKIQARVQREISDTIKGSSEAAVFEDLLNKFEYLDCIIFETLRLHPPVHTLNKVCTKDYKLPSQFGDEREGVVIPKGTPIVIPSNAIHSDPTYYTNPHVFDPERFDEENKFAQNFTFLSFGEGSRMCLGRKFGLAQTKYGLARILSKYNLKLSSKTEQPLRIASRTFFLAAKRGLWIEFSERDE